MRCLLFKRNGRNLKATIFVQNNSMALTTSSAGGSKCSPVYACTANTLDLLSAGDGTSIMLLFFLVVVVVGDVLLLFGDKNLSVLTQNGGSDSDNANRLPMTV